MIENLDEILSEDLEAHKLLDVYVYRGLHLNRRVDDIQVIDQWLEKGMDRISLEKLLNHLHVYDLASTQDYAEEAYQQIATELECAWNERLAPVDRRFVVERYEDYGPTVTFYLDDAGEMMKLSGS